MNAYHGIDLTNDEIAAAFWGLFLEIQNHRHTALDQLDKAMADAYSAPDIRLDAERKVRRTSDEEIILGQVIERAKASRLVKAAE